MAEQQVSVAEQKIIREQIRDFLQQNFLYAGDAHRLDDDASLIESGVIDSTGVLELVLFVEETYRIQVEQEDLQPENFDSVRSVVEYVAARLGDE